LRGHGRNDINRIYRFQEFCTMAETSHAAANDADNTEAPKNKLVRDSFTIPKAEYAVLNELKQRATRLTQPAKKSELLRAGIALLKGLSDQAFLTALAAVPNLKTGRPRKDGQDEAGDKVKRHVKDKTAPKARANGAAASASKPERVAARAARVAARPERAAAKAERVAAKPDKAAAKAERAARADKPSKPEKLAAKAAKAAAKGRSTT
jgi:hypothetical protein